MRYLIPLTALAFVLAACGGGGGSERLSKDEFDSKGNAICKKLNDARDALPQPNKLSDIPPFVDKLRPKFEDAVSDMKKLKPPEDLQDRFDRFLDLGDEAVDRLDRFESTAKAGDMAAYRKVANESTQADKESDALARELGLEECTKG